MECLCIQIQLLLKLNQLSMVAYYYVIGYSNTTLVKVKFPLQKVAFMVFSHSNTTLVKVKCRVRLCPMCQWRIQIQLLLKLN